MHGLGLGDEAWLIPEIWGTDQLMVFWWTIKFEAGARRKAFTPELKASAVPQRLLSACYQEFSFCLPKPRFGTAQTNRRSQSAALCLKEERADCPWMLFLASEPSAGVYR